MEFMENWEQAEKFDNLKNKMMKYILYKKRSEQEIRQKFSDEDENMVEDAIQYLTEAGYIDDKAFIERSINEFIALKSLSIKEISYKLCDKGIKKSLVDEYIYENRESLLEYEISSAKSIILKKQSKMEEPEIKNYLYKKGYMSESVNIAFDEIEE